MLIRKKIVRLNRAFINSLSRVNFLPALLFRFILAYGFYEPAMKKIQHFDSIIIWFDDMGLPAPALNAYLATGTELLGVFLLILGLGTRLISIPLIFTMFVAIKTVHWHNGFSSSDNGYEIPLYYMLMLISLLIMGPGKISVDYLINRKIKNL